MGSCDLNPGVLSPWPVPPAHFCLLRTKTPGPSISVPVPPSPFLEGSHGGLWTQCPTQLVVPPDPFAPLHGPIMPLAGGSAMAPFCITDSLLLAQASSTLGPQLQSSPYSFCGTLSDTSTFASFNWSPSSFSRCRARREGLGRRGLLPVPSGPH